MIFEHALRRELSLTAGAVFLVLLTFMLTTLVIRILGMAANGEANPSDVLLLIGLATLGYLAILLCATLFISVLLVLTRWYKDSEMVVWFTSGLSLTDFIGPVLRFAMPFVALVAFLALFGWPWANQQSALFRDRFEQRDVLSMISAGHFIEPAHGRYVLFIESVNETLRQARNVFVANVEQDKIGVALARTGTFTATPNGDRHVVLDRGRRYEGAPGKLDYRIIEFDAYSVKVANKPPHTDANLPTKSRSSADLLAHPTPDNQGELLWRIGLPLLALNFVLIAIPLAHVNPRLGRYTPMIFAVLIYLTYSNLLNLSQAWVSQGKLDFMLAWWPLHLAALCCAGLLFAWRQGSAAGWRSRWRARPGSASGRTAT